MKKCIFYLIVLFQVQVFGQEKQCQRIVSLAPSITEILFELGLGSNLVGVTQYDTYPAEAKRLEKVGGFFDVNLERIFILKPDIVFLLQESQQDFLSLTNLKLKVISINHKNVQGIFESIQSIGELCGLPDKSQTLLTRINQEKDGIINKYQHSGGNRVLIIVSVAAERNLYISGKDGFYSELLKYLGLQNAYEGNTSMASALSQEGLIAIDPDMIIEIGEVNTEGKVKEFLSKDIFKDLKAVRNNNVYYINDDFASIPGPRFPKLLAKIANLNVKDK